MSRRTYGILAGVIGSALGAWFWNRQRAGRRTGDTSERGRVIFDNTPVASTVDPLDHA